MPAILGDAARPQRSHCTGPLKLSTRRAGPPPLVNWPHPPLVSCKVLVFLLPGLLHRTPPRLAAIFFFFKKNMIFTSDAPQEIFCFKTIKDQRCHWAPPAKKKKDFSQFNIAMCCPQHLFLEMSDSVSSNKPIVCPVRTDFFHVWALQSYTHYLGEGESVMHKGIGFFYPYRNTSLMMKLPHLYLFTSAKNSHPTPTNSCSFPPLSTTSLKMDPHRWSLKTTNSLALGIPLWSAAIIHRSVD